jgi:hypothetical protein
MNSNENNGSRIAQVQSRIQKEDGIRVSGLRFRRSPHWLKTARMRNNQRSHATREGSDGKSGIEKSKLIMLGGGLLAAVLFLALTSLVNHSSIYKEGRREAAKSSGTATNAKPIQGERHAPDGDRSQRRSGEYQRAGSSRRH